MSVTMGSPVLENSNSIEDEDSAQKCESSFLFSENEFLALAFAPIVIHGEIRILPSYLIILMKMLFPTQVKIMSNKFIFFVLVVNFLYIAIDNKYQDLLLYLNASSTTEDVKIYRIITELYEESNGIVVPAARKIRTFLLGIHALIVLIRLLTSSEKTVNIRFVVRS